MRTLPLLRPLAARALLCATLLTWGAAAQAPMDVRVALVIGNAAYPGAAALTNPANDARAMALSLRRLGFQVVQVLDGNRQQMLQALAAMRAQLAGKQAVGMLFYAGHGLQLDWRNFMVPVDARLSGPADVPAQTVEIEAVIQTFKDAGNRMNILVLDACRDNPFAGSASGKGLAQLDAVPGTYLAYATAPGNVAEDGTAGAGNGLFTQYLLQELQRPARIEDVFKRVRLQVRRQSQGRQVPWDSSSLEEDFYFNDGERHRLSAQDLEQDQAQRAAVDRALQEQAVVAKAAALRESEAARREREFAAEKADWDQIRDSRKPEDFYAFLLRYPNGLISLQANAALARLEPARISSQADRNGMQEREIEERFRVGDHYVYRRTDAYSNRPMGREEAVVNRIADGLVYFNEGTADMDVRNLDGAYVREGRRNGTVITYDPPRMDLPADSLAVGKRWTGRTIQTNDGRPLWRDDVVRVAALEDVTVPAGTFKAYRVEMRSSLQDGSTRYLVRWFTPGWGLAVKILREVRPRSGAPTREIVELTSRERGKA